jgi:hypothetical protein
LLTGKIFCACCGARLVTSTAGKRRVRKDGTIYERRYWRYLCYNRMRHKEKCDGPSGYMASKIDEAVCEVVRGLLSQIKSVPLASIVNKKQSEHVKETKSKLAAAEKTLKKATDNLKTLKLEIVNAIRGESDFTSELLREMIELAEKERDSTELTIIQLTEQCQNAKRVQIECEAQHDKLISWAEIFDKCDFDIKKMIVYEIVDKVIVGESYDIHVELAISMKQYMELTTKEYSVA